MDAETIRRFEFKDDVPANAIGETLEVALMAASSLHGAGRVRLDASCRIDERLRLCEIDASNEVGKTLASVFVGLAEAEFGRDSFEIVRSGGAPAAA